MSLVSDKSVEELAKAALQDPELRASFKKTAAHLKGAKSRAQDELGNWEEWRERGSAIRSHTIAHLDYYLEQFAGNVTAKGGHVHFARTAEDALAVVTDIVRKKAAKLVVKSKSMVSEEIHLNQALEKLGVEVVETDLGEYIIQLANEKPSHIIAPAIHKNRRQIARLFSKVKGETLPEEPAQLTQFARRELREKFLQADIGITGCNFAVAESGAVTLVTNEGNGRMVNTLPKTHIVLMGMERIVPTWEDLEVMINLLPRSGTGQKITVYFSVINRARREDDRDGPEELHVVILDNGRSEQLGDQDFQEVLNCIRCGACLNVCPVYRQIGGHAYGSVYSGPIGAVLTPLLNRDSDTAARLAYASSLCGACYEACPVKIPLHDMLIKLRKRNVEKGRTSFLEKLAYGAYGKVFANPDTYRRVTKAAGLLQKPFVKEGEVAKSLPVLAHWTDYRAFPAKAKRSFREAWLEQERGKKK